MLKKYLVAVAFLMLFSSPFSHAASVNINTADAIAMAQALNGIGVTKAQAIVEYRGKNGDFQSIDDLVNVKGIGSKLVARNRSLILLNDGKASLQKTNDTPVKSGKVAGVAPPSAESAGAPPALAN